MTNSSSNTTGLTPLLSRLELAHGERYMLTVHPSIALECILALLARGYSLHVEADEGKVMIRSKNKGKHSFQISKEASRLIKEHTGIDITEKISISSNKGRIKKKREEKKTL